MEDEAGFRVIELLAVTVGENIADHMVATLGFGLPTMSHREAFCRLAVFCTFAPHTLPFHEGSPHAPAVARGRPAYLRLRRAGLR